MFPWPVPGHEEVSSHYGDRREYNQYKLHLGTDVRAPTGADVVAGAGQIIFANWAGSAGRSVYLDMGGYRVHYCHLSGFNVTAGQAVQAGDIIGWVGGSGDGVDDAYASHLHLNLFAAERPATGPSHWVAWVGMWAVDPERYFSKEDNVLTPEDKRWITGQINGAAHNLMHGKDMILDKMVEVRNAGNADLEEKLLAAIRAIRASR